MEKFGLIFVTIKNIFKSIYIDGEHLNPKEKIKNKKKEHKSYVFDEDIFKDENEPIWF